MYEDVHSVHCLVIKDLKVQYFLFFKGITIELNMKVSRAKPPPPKKKKPR